MPDITAAITKAIIGLPWIKWALSLFSKSKSLRAERRAGRGEFPPANSIAPLIKNTLKRLGSSNEGDPWWEKVSAEIGGRFIRPNFLDKPAVSEWLSRPNVIEDFTTIISLRNLGQDGTQCFNRLASAYSEATGDSIKLAKGPIENILNILTASLRSHLTKGETVLAHQNQCLAEKVEAGFKETQKLLPHFNDRHHIAKAQEELLRILKCRAHSGDRAAREIEELASRVEKGDLQYASDEIRANIFYWAARIP
jgi:hypothetical protein